MVIGILERFETYSPEYRYLNSVYSFFEKKNPFLYLLNPRIFMSRIPRIGGNVMIRYTPHHIGP